MTGVAGAWVIAAHLDEAATALLGGYIGATWVAEVKALIGGNTVAVWDGTCAISQGVVRAIV